MRKEWTQVYVRLFAAVLITVLPIAAILQPAKAETANEPEAPHFVYTYWTGNRLAGLAEVPENAEPCYVRVVFCQENRADLAVTVPVGKDGEFILWYHVPCTRLTLVLADRPDAFLHQPFTVYDSMELDLFLPHYNGPAEREARP